MSQETTASEQPHEIRWTPRLIRRLRGQRTQTEFGILLGAPKNTVWRWEAGHARPDARYVTRLSALARNEHFLADWELVGSMTLLSDLGSAKDDIARLFRTSLARTYRQLAE